MAGVEVRKGSLVRVHPNRRADAQDLFFDDQVARVTAVLSDVDGGTHVAVVLADDPAADLHDWYGRYFYFAPDEIEPLAQTEEPQKGTAMRVIGKLTSIVIIAVGAVAAVVGVRSISDLKRYRRSGACRRVTDMTILVAGIGNIFDSDDGFGPEVVRRMVEHAPVTPGVRIVDYGIRGMHLAYDLLEGYDALVLVDAVAVGDTPGEVTVLEVGPDDLASMSPGDIDAHGMSPVTVLASLNGSEARSPDLRGRLSSRHHRGGHRASATPSPTPYPPPSTSSRGSSRPLQVSGRV